MNVTKWNLSSNDASMKRTIEKYKKIINSFLTEDITVDDFEKEYLKMFLSETGIMPEELFWPLNNLFIDVDAYYPEATDEEDLTEEQLRESAKQTLDKLSNL